MSAAGRRRARAASLVAAALALAPLACSKTSPAPSWQLAQSRRDEIMALWIQVRDWRREAGMNVDPTPVLIQSMRDKSVSAAQRVCPDRVPPPACTDICDLGDAICDNAENICAISVELGNDAWSAEKCASAKASCKEAKQRCCACSQDGTSDAAP
ncbi:MAG: hypothetical protein KBG28_16920 [Kofleriaceae bacterium]|nr:hypothetical protein [Kofleriaceae bacterium]MBP9205657.1 hypothetical protein [Kofleriaceae bacterium]